MRNLDFASLLEIIQKQVKNAYIDPYSGRKGVSQQEAVYLLYGAVVGEDDKELYVSSGTATKLFHRESNVSTLIADEARRIESKKQQYLVEERVSNMILKPLQDGEKESLWAALQKWLREAQPVTMQFGLNDAIGLPYGEKTLCTLLSTCILLCSRLMNKISGRGPEPAAVQLVPECPAGSGRQYDPHGIQGSQSNSNTLEIHITGMALDRIFYSQELAVEYIMERDLLIRQIRCTARSIEVQCAPLPSGLYLRRLKPEDFEQVRTGIRNHPEEVRIKKSWKVPLCEMIYRGLEKGELTGYGYFTRDEVLVSYLDYRLRVDGGVELFSQITCKDYRRMGITTGLIDLFRLKFFNSKLLVGTYEENTNMISLLKRCGFLPHFFYDEDLKRNVCKVQDRLGANGSDAPEDMTNSVYFYSNSLLFEVYRRGLEESSAEPKQEKRTRRRGR